MAQIFSTEDPNEAHKKLNYNQILVAFHLDHPVLLEYVLLEEITCIIIVPISGKICTLPQEYSLSSRHVKLPSDLTLYHRQVIPDYE